MTQTKSNVLTTYFLFNQYPLETVEGISRRYILIESLILVTFLFDRVLIYWGEVRWWSMFAVVAWWYQFPFLCTWFISTVRGLHSLHLYITDLTRGTNWYANEISFFENDTIAVIWRLFKLNTATTCFRKVSFFSRNVLLPQHRCLRCSWTKSGSVDPFLS